MVGCVRVCDTGIDGIITADTAVIDGGITPYQLPKPVTYLVGIKDFLMTMAGKYMSIKALSSVFDPEKYSGDDIIYIKKVLNGMSIRTIWLSHPMDRIMHFQ